MSDMTLTYSSFRLSSRTTACCECFGSNPACAKQETFLVLDKTHPSTSHLPDTWHFVSASSLLHVEQTDM